MSRTEAQAAAGGGLSPADEAREAVTGFLSDFKDFQTDLETKLQRQEERLTMLDRKALSHARTPLGAATDLEAPHQKAFNTYLRSGDDADLRGLEMDQKGMTSAINADGGFLVDPATSETIHSVLMATSSLRSIAQVVQVEATSYDVLVDHSELATGWASETATQAETDTPQIDRISVPLHELTAMPRASQRLLEDSAFDIEAWLAGRIAERFARAEAAAFVTGDGIDKPTGFLTKPAVDDDVWSWGNLGYVVTGTSGDTDADAIIDLVYALGAEYRAGAQFVMNSKTAGTVRKLKDAEGRFIWTDSFAAGEPARLMGYPVLICEDMPDPAADSLSIAFGDFANGYTIAERPDLRVLRDPFSAKPHVLFFASKRVGGDVTDFAAIKLLKFGTA